MYQRRQWHPTPGLLPGKSHGRRSLEGCSPWVAEGRTRLSNFTFTFMHWRRKWQPTPVFLPGESQGRGILVGCRLWGRIESDTTEVTQQQHAMYDSTILSMLTEALLSFTKVPLKICRRQRSCSTFRTFGLTSLTPLILTTNANLGSAGT